jgi:mono/diheme cytochrome c family protein
MKTLANVIAVLLIVLDGMAVLAQREKPETVRQSTYAALQEASSKAQARMNPFEGNAQASSVGAKLFEQHCAECHGKTAEGTRKGPTLVHNAIKQATPGALFWVLTNGVVRQGMPVWSKLPESQRWQLVTFLKSLNDHSAAH